MKTPTPVLLRLALLAGLAAAGALRAAEPETIKFTGAAGTPRILRVAVPMADVTITGADVDTVAVVSDRTAAQPSKPRPDGLRVIASGSAYQLVEKDNVVSLTQDHSALVGGPGEFKITVPRDVKVIANVEINGDVRVTGVRGDLEVANLNGTIRLEDVAGSVSASTMNGEIRASYAALTDGKVHAFSSMNGEIELRVPVGAKATFKCRAQNGTVLTDLPEDAFVTRAENSRADGERLSADRLRDAARAQADATRALAEADQARVEAARIEAEATAPEAPAADGEKRGPAPRAPKPPRPPKAPRVPTFPAFGGQVVTGTLNGGGVQIQATTMNGEIKIRAAK